MYSLYQLGTVLWTRFRVLGTLYLLCRDPIPHAGAMDDASGSVPRNMALCKLFHPSAATASL